MLNAKNPTDRIVGGVEAKKNSWPWIARLSIDGRYGCGGTIIDEKTILTAGHCVANMRRGVQVLDFKPNLGTDIFNR